MSKLFYAHDLEYVRTQIIPALADMLGETKGQLAAFEDSPLICTDYYKRNKTYLRVENRWVAQDTDPIFCPETRMRRQPNPPINPITYNLSSWRRAILAMNPPKQSWILYCYARDLDYRHQTEICQYLWRRFMEAQSGRKMLVKVQQRLGSLVWLAVQQHAGVCRKDGIPHYTRADLVHLAGVSIYNWKNRYAGYWQELLCLCEELDRQSLQDITKLRIAQKQNVNLQKCPV
ncbi:hypothetical protein ID852_05420 [Xenorhabdus sp. 42]|uniref:bacteriophage antitermination protein Q n=1 Tax=Xenorhabdus szentirmaii TaxID=290112 RepID=UPI0019AA09F6|nr:bacteriophage antitermination protein Q [Xenorhabdus sp. 42]MBD2820136.1 hypothetical protein [Xenorhabdus sp. 42]